MQTSKPDFKANEGHLGGVILVIAAGVLWSTVGIGIRLIEDASVWQILFFRSFSLSCFLFGVMYLRFGNLFRQIRIAGIPAIIAGLSLVGAYSGGIYSIQSTSVANAMLLVATAPFFAAVLGWVFLWETIRKSTFIMIIFALLGVGIMVSDDLTGVELRGSLAAIGSAIAFAVFTVALRWGKSVEMLPAVFLSGVFGVIITGVMCLGLNSSFSLSQNDLSIAIGMGIFQVGAGLVLYTLGSKALPAAQLAMFSLSEVLLAPLWVWLFLGETISVNTLYGGLVLLSAIVFNAILVSKNKGIDCG